MKMWKSLLWMMVLSLMTLPAMGQVSHTPTYANPEWTVLMQDTFPVGPLNTTKWDVLGIAGECVDFGDGDDGWYRVTRTGWDNPPFGIISKQRFNFLVRPYEFNIRQWQNIGWASCYVCINVDGTYSLAGGLYLQAIQYDYDETNGAHSHISMFYRDNFDSPKFLLSNVQVPYEWTGNMSIVVGPTTWDLYVAGPDMDVRDGLHFSGTHTVDAWSFTDSATGQTGAKLGIWTEASWVGEQMLIIKDATVLERPNVVNYNWVNAYQETFPADKPLDTTQWDTVGTLGTFIKYAWDYSDDGWYTVTWAKNQWKGLSNKNRFNIFEKKYEFNVKHFQDLGWNSSYVYLNRNGKSDTNTGLRLTAVNYTGGNYDTVTLVAYEATTRTLVNAMQIPDGASQNLSLIVGPTTWELRCAYIPSDISNSAVLASGTHSLDPATLTDPVTGDVGVRVGIMGYVSGTGNQTLNIRDITVMQEPTGELVVTPISQQVESEAGTTSFEVNNGISGSMNWTAEVISGSEWLSLTSGTSGTDAGTIVASFTANPDSVSRTGKICITAPGALNNPRYLTVVQAELTRIKGDANGDGMVDVGDLGILAANYGGSDKTWEQGDFNGDGLVDVGDLGILAANYGTGVEAAVDFNADYAKAFGTSAEEDAEEDSSTNNSLCGALGLPLIAALALMGLMLVKSEE